MTFQSQAKITIIFKPNSYTNKGVPLQEIQEKKFFGSSAREQAEQYAKQWLSNDNVQNIVCKSQCVLCNA